MEPLFRFLCAFVGAMAITRMTVTANAQPKDLVTVVSDYPNEELWPGYSYGSPKDLLKHVTIQPPSSVSQANCPMHIATCIIEQKDEEHFYGLNKEPHPALFLVTMNEENQQQQVRIASALQFSRIFDYVHRAYKISKAFVDMDFQLKVRNHNGHNHHHDHNTIYVYMVCLFLQEKIEREVPVGLTEQTFDVSKDRRFTRDEEISLCRLWKYKPQSPVQQPIEFAGSDIKNSDKAFLLNEFECPQPIRFEGQNYPSADHLLQAWKVRLMPGTHDKADAAERIRESKNPVKKSRNIHGLKWDQSLWESNLPEFARRAMILKFQQNPDLRAKLLKTGNAPLRYSEPSNVWGNPTSTSSGVIGQLLGRTLEKIRDDIAVDKESLPRGKEMWVVCHYKYYAMAIPLIFPSGALEYPEGCSCFHQFHERIDMVKRVKHSPEKLPENMRTDFLRPFDL